MDPVVRRLIEAIHAAPCRCVLALTGGGAQAAATLLNVPGGSRTVLEVIVPYHEQALIEFLGRRPPSFCSAETASAMAERAHARSQWLAPGECLIGLGCTAALVSDRPKRGAHRVHIAVHTELLIARYSLTLTKGARDREAEEGVVDAVIFNALATAMNLVERVELPLFPGEQLETNSTATTHPLVRLVRGEIAAFCVQPDGRQVPSAPLPAVLMPGSFNPFHDGHRQLADVAARRTEKPVAFELSITNVDKPPLSADEVRRRIAQFGGWADLWLTRAPTFSEKSELFPGVTFVIGSDTASRLVRHRYYGDSPERTADALNAIRARGCKFLVAGRVDAAGRFVPLDRVEIPEVYRDLFTAIPETEFRADLSSTILRSARAVAADAADG
jgi:hypothetical protein